MEITTTTTMTHSEIRMDQNTTTTTSNLRTKPPLPPKQPPMPHTIAADVTVPAKSEPTKTKGNHIQNRIDDENNAHQKTQRLIAMNDKLNLELAAVRKSLQHERAGVRELRWGKRREWKRRKIVSFLCCVVTIVAVLIGPGMSAHAHLRRARWVRR